MLPPRPAYVVYFLGILAFGFWYEWLRVRFGEGWKLFVVALLFLVFLRVAAELIERALCARATRKQRVPPHDDA